MLAWLEASGHWGFIAASLAVSALLLLIDIVPPWLKQQQLLKDIRAQAKRAQARGSQQ
jgi:heme exporter protein CcmD